MNDYTIDLSRMQVKKRQTLFLADSYERLSVRPGFGDFRRRAALCRNCGNYLKYGVLSDGTSKLVDANFCRQRLCPACSFRRSHKAYANISSVMNFVQKFSDSRFIFLTLTVRNVPGEKLSLALNDMTDGFKRLISNRGMCRRFRGIIRTTEVTVNDDAGTFHPHFHCILAVGPDYFTDPDLYWTPEQWSSAWRRCLWLDYDPVVWVSRLYGSDGGIKEVSKYVVKPSSLLDGPLLIVDERVLVLHQSLHGRRLLAYTGIFADARRALNIEEEEDDDLLDRITRGDVFKAFVTYHWGFGANAYQIEKEEYL